MRLSALFAFILLLHASLTFAAASKERPALCQMAIDSPEAAVELKRAEVRERLYERYPKHDLNDFYFHGAYLLDERQLSKYANRVAQNLRQNNPSLSAEQLDPVIAAYARRIEISLRNDLGEKIAKIVVNSRNETLRFDIEVPSKYTRLGIYSYAIGSMVLLLPRIKFIPADMPGNESKNVRIFMKQAFGGARQFHQQLAPYRLFRSESPTLAVMRENILAAFAFMPSTKARLENGFGKIHHITLTPIGELVSFQIEKGMPISPEETRVFINTGDEHVGVYELLPSGELVGAPASILSLPDYVPNVHLTPKIEIRF